MVVDERVTCDECWDVMGKHSMFSHCARKHAAFASVLRLPSPKPSVRSIFCDACDFSTHSRFNLVSHLAKRHGLLPRPALKTLRCDTCLYVATGSGRMHEHLLVHRPTQTRPSYRKVSCDVCGHRGTRRNLHRHWLLGHTQLEDRFRLSLTPRPKQIFRCDECEKPLTAVASMVQHCRIVHLGLKGPEQRQTRLGCDECGAEPKRADFVEHWVRRHGPPRARALLRARWEASAAARLRRQPACDHCGDKPTPKHFVSHVLRCSLPR